MPKPLSVVQANGTLNHREVLILAYLLILAALAYVAALAINELMEAILKRYVRKDSIIGNVIYAVVAIALVILIVYLGCWWHPDVIHYINISPVRMANINQVR